MSVQFLIERASAYAAYAHAGQLYGPFSYTTHLDEVVKELEKVGFKPEGQEVFFAAAWLHDVLEDTEVTHAILCQEFGTVVSSVVWAVTGVGGELRCP